MDELDNAQLGISVSGFLDSLFLQELGDDKYDPQVVALVKQHLGESQIHSRAGDRLAEALLQLAKERAQEESQ